MQGLRIIKADERFPLEFDEGFTIHHRRLKPSEFAEIVKKHTVRGDTDWMAVTEDTAKAAIVDWDNVHDGSENVPFDTSLVGGLPMWVQSRVFDAAVKSNLAGELKNFPTTHDSNPTTTD